MSELSRHDLAMALRALRERKGLTQQQVAERLLWSNSKMCRVEDGTRNPVLSDLLLLLPLYNVPATEIDRYVTLARDARRPSPYRSFKDVLSENEMIYFDSLEHAHGIHDYAGLSVPLLLRTHEYEAALRQQMGQGPHQDNWALAFTRVQTTITRSDPPSMRFLIDESVLLRRVGSRTIMRRQLEHLQQLSDLATISVVPFLAGVHAARQSSFTVVELSENHPDMSIMFIPGLSPTVKVLRDRKVIDQVDRDWALMLAAATPITDLRAA